MPQLATRHRTALRLQEAGEGPLDRRATWTELFFDLVFVVAIAQLADALHADVSVRGAAVFAGLFVPVWWTWTTYAYAADLFDDDEGAFGAVLVGAMLLVAGMAATIPHAFDGRTAGFVVAYGLLRADLVALYAWAQRTDARLRPLVGPHLVGFTAGGLIFVASLAVPGAARYAVWALAIAVDLITGVLVYVRRGDLPRHLSHMPERFGLFTLIVLGEAIIAVSVGTAQADWAVGSALTAALGFALAAALWRLYFARFDADVFNWALAGGPSERRRSFVFGYGHLPLLAAIAAVGVGVWVAIEEAVRGGPAAHAAPLLGVALAAALLALSAIQSAAPAGLPARVLAGRLAVAALAGALAAVGDGLDSLALMAILAIALVAQTAFEAALDPVGSRAGG
ncbi:MAG TPA: low temperature requirement protein A [Thermoleophilaceae bacterium]